MVRFSSRDNVEVDDSFLCDRGRYGYGFIQHADRLKTPLLRSGSKLEPVSWAEAFDYVATRLKKSRLKHGADAIGGIASTTPLTKNFMFFKSLCGR